MSNSFRIDESELRGWHAALAQRMELRGVPAIAKEIEAHLARKEADGSVAVSRHQLFTWAEALQGASSRDTRAASVGTALSLPQVVADMRAILSGKPAGGGGAPSSAPSPSPFSEPAAPAAARPSYAPPPAVTYAPPSAASAGAGARVLTGAALGETVRALIRGATRELYVSSPWATGVETLVADIVATPPTVRALLLSRRPDRDDGAFHQAMDQLGRRRAVTAWSPHIQTRMLLVDGERAIVGAASVPGAISREIGLLVTDAATIAQLREHFERAHAEAAGGKY